MDSSKKAYQEYLNKKFPFVENDIFYQGNNKRRKANKRAYGDYFRKADPIKFEVDYQEWLLDNNLVISDSKFQNQKPITIRTYCKGHDEFDRWACYCGGKNEEYNIDKLPEDRDGYLIGECCHCNRKVKLVFKRFRANRGKRL